MATNDLQHHDVWYEFEAANLATSLPEGQLAKIENVKLLSSYVEFSHTYNPSPW